MYKEYEIKIKMVHQQQLQLKIQLLLGYNVEIFYLWGELTIDCGDKSLVEVNSRGVFQLGGISNSRLVRGDCQLGKP